MKSQWGHRRKLELPVTEESMPKFAAADVLAIPVSVCFVAAAVSECLTSQ